MSAFSIFLTPIWCRALANGLGYDVRMHELTLDDSGATIGRCLVRHGTRGPLQKGVRPFATPFNLEWCSPVNDAIRRHVFRGLSWRQRLITLEVREQCMTTEPKGQYIMTLQQHLQHGDLWAQYRPVVRRSVKQAIRAGVHVKQQDDPELFYALLRRHSEANLGRGLPFAAQQFVEFFRLLHAEAHVATFVSENQHGETTAAHLCVQGAPWAYDVLSCRHVDHLRSPDNYLLTHEILQYYKAAGFSVFDYCGANLAHIEEFKRRFSPKEAFWRQRNYGMIAFGR